MDKPHIETLCYKCADDYEEAGFELIKIPNQENKDQCTHCQTGVGWDYRIIKPFKD